MKLSYLSKLTQSLPAGADPTDAAWRNAFLRSQGLDPGNLYQELEMDSPFVNTHRDTSQVNSQVNLHSHSFYELLLCRNGDGVEYLVGAERYRLRKGDVVIVPPGLSHRPLLPAQMSEPYIRDVLWISTEFMQQLRRWIPDIFMDSEHHSTVLHPDEQTQTILGKLFGKGIQEAESQQTDGELALIGNTITLLVQLHRACAARTAQPTPAEKPELLDQVLQYVEDHLSQKITLADVAHHFFVSESTIAQLFRKKMGVSFYHCVTQRRLIAAKALIGQDVPLESVSDQVGFSDYSTFYKAFKKEYGISPRQYRQLQEPNVAQFP